MLHPVKGRAYCGPTSIAAITGLDVETVKYVVRKVNGKKFVKGMFNIETKKTLHALGYEIQSSSANHAEDNPTLARWFRTRKDRKELNLLHLTGHYIAVQGNKLVDTQTSGEVVNIGDAPRRRKRVKHVWKVIKIDTPTANKKAQQLIAEAKSKTRRRSPVDPGYKAWRKWVKRLGFKYELEYCGSDRSMPNYVTILEGSQVIMGGMQWTTLFEGWGDLIERLHSSIILFHEGNFREELQKDEDTLMYSV